MVLNQEMWYRDPQGAPIAGSSKGRMADFESAHRGSTPRPAAYWRVAQSVERLPVKETVAGSSPAMPAIAGLV